MAATISSEELPAADHNKEENIDQNGSSPPAKQRDHLLQWMDITVSEPEKRTGAGGVKMQDTFVVYLVETRIKDEDMRGYGNPPTSAWHRFSEFELLRNYLEVTYPFIVVPPIPEKRVSHAWQKLSTDRFDSDFIERRRIGLENFLLRVASHTKLCKDAMFLSFLTKDEGWKESVYATDFQNQADSKLRALSASYRLKKQDRKFEEMKNYSSELQTNLTNILRIRAKLADRLYGLHKLHANYARVFKEWSAIERDMGEGLKNTSNFMDVYADSVEAYLEDEELFADQLKEYYSFGDSIRNVCRKQELMQLDVEKLEDSLVSKSQQKEQLTEGKTSSFSFSGMKSKLFGSDTPEQREQKIKNLEESIKENEEQLDIKSRELEEFMVVAQKDLSRFRRQKVKDLKDVFLNYSVLQIERCKKNIGLWQNARESFTKM